MTSTHSATLAAGLRDLADAVEQGRLPARIYPDQPLSIGWHVAALDEVLATAAVHGDAVVTRASEGGQWSVRLRFGPVEVSVVHISDERMQQYAAERSYDANIAAAIRTTGQVPA